MAESPSKSADELLFRLSIDEDTQQTGSPNVPPQLHIESPNERDPAKPLAGWEEVDERVDENELLAQAELKEKQAASLPNSVPIPQQATVNKDYDVEIIETSSPVDTAPTDSELTEKKSDFPETSKSKVFSFHFVTCFQRIHVNYVLSN